MGFLTEQDYSVQIRNEIKTVLTNNNEASLDLAEQMAQEEMSGYLRVRGYDVALVFGAIGAERNAEIIMRMVDITLYHLHSNIVTRSIPSHREKRYNDTLDWMYRVSQGKLALNLPAVTEGDSTPKIKLGSNKKYSPGNNRL